ncbi:MAG: hypothetical protein JWM76_2030 [Pseudonocardiales bacterium]|nr:hypothetical protein [Pseudonocardiales bacterium]
MAGGWPAEQAWTPRLAALPAALPTDTSAGAHELVLVGSQASASFSIVVVADTSTIVVPPVDPAVMTPGQLAGTGSDVVAPGVAGILLVAIGGLIAINARRRVRN